ncbi:MAG TPA: NADPH:quinone oxidoreductase family protein [Stellaceae bacterium]|jgi:NADPH2:quinone reductase|nr:NADPH:quinone oxidoreductase family protein [Stellaceae bacterium]
MRAVLCKELGGPEKLVLEEVPSPALSDGGVLIDIHAAGVNFADILLIAGQYQDRAPLPFIPGMEVGGVVRAVAAGVTQVKPGDRVLASVGRGAFAEQVAVEADSVHPIPDSMDFATAAGFPVAYGTSHGAFLWRARLQPGETVLVLGASGGVGLTAVEIAKAMGARVIAAAGGAEKLAIAQRAGADHLVDYTSEDLRERIKAITGGRGADVVYDPVGGDAFDQSLRAIAWEGRMIVIGFAAGRIQQIPANLVLVKNIDVIGFFWGSYRRHKPHLLGDSYRQLFRWFEEGKLKPHISHQLPLERTGEALALLKQRKSTGKVVVTTR